MKRIDRTALRSFILSDSGAMFFGGIGENREKWLFGDSQENWIGLRSRPYGQLNTQFKGIKNGIRET